MRRIYITLAVLFVGMIGMAYLYFSNLNTETDANDLSLKAVASNSAIIFSFENDKSFYDILEGQDLFQHVIGESNSKLLKSIQTNIIDQPTLTDLIDGQKVYVGILPGNNNEIDFLISTQIKNNANAANAFNQLNNKQTTAKKIGNAYQLIFSDSSTCFIAIKDNLAVVSNKLAEVENAIKKDGKEESFSNFVKTNSRFNKNILANLYVDFNKLPSLLKNVLNTNINGELNIFNKQNTYAALSYNFSKERLLFNGYTQIESENSFYKLFANISEQKITITTILPDKTANYTVFSIIDYNNWHKDLLIWMKDRKEEELINKSLIQINEKYSLDLSQIFPKYFKNQVVTFQLNTGEKLGAIALTNGEKVNQLLLDISTDYAPEVRIFKESNIPYAYFGEPFKKFERPFYTIIDGYLVMANNASSIQSFLNSYKNDKLLINDINYQDFSNQLSASATISHYINFKNSTDIFGKNLKQPYYNQVTSKSGLGKFNAFSYQLSGDKGKFLSNVLLYQTLDQKNKLDTAKIIK